MKTFIKASVTLVCMVSALIFLSCCSFLSGYSVTFVYNNGEEDVTLETYVIERPNDPEREGYIFLGWCSDPELENYYDFSARLTSDIVLYARWMKDYRDITNDITHKAMSANVKIVGEFYLSRYSPIPSYKSQGSGVIYAEDLFCYYILTNNHVVNGDAVYSKESFTVEDAFGYEYAAQLLASDESYDLAVLKIQKNPEHILAVLKPDDREVSEHETVIALGSPREQMNAMTYGELVAYKEIDKEGIKGYDTDVEFAVLWHTANTTNGSSGGALIDDELRLIGINFAVALDSEGDFLCCFAVPVPKINEFLNKYSADVK